MKNHLPDQTAVWKAEYEKQGIPSSFRMSPSKTLEEFLLWFEEKNFKGKTAADLGCGLGRNSYYLASRGFSVTAIDLLQENADQINQEAKRSNLPIQAFGQDLSHEWPIRSESLDVAIDIFCYKHIVNKQAQQRYRRELWKALKADGYYLISLASIDDGFYGPLLQKSLSSEENLVIDSHANIASYLYSMTGIIKEFSDLFEIVEASEKTSQSPMHGREYTRKLLSCICKKKVAMEYLFSYATLRYENVQMATFGRKLEGTEDVLSGYRIEKLKILSPDVIAKSGEEVHSIIKFSGNLQDSVPGTVFKVTAEELMQADEYEVADYKRVKVDLRSGQSAWVYVYRS